MALVKKNRRAGDSRCRDKKKEQEKPRTPGLFHYCHATLLLFYTLK